MQAQAQAEGLMQTKDWWFLIATIASPFLSAGLTALFTLRWQDRKEKRDAKLRVFSTLMAVRGNILNFQAAQEWVRSLQLIDVVFADAPDVFRHWPIAMRCFSKNTHSRPKPQDDRTSFAMATHLGFDKLTQTVIDKAHFPKAISEPIAKANENSPSS